MPAGRRLVQSARSRCLRSTTALVVCLAGVLSATAGAVPHVSRGHQIAADASLTARLESTVRTSHLEYVFDEGRFSVFDIDRGQKLVAQVALPQARGVRGVAVSTHAPILYLSYGGDGGSNGNGSLLAFDLIHRQVLWTREYGTGIDSFALTPDGKRIYMPTGELSSGGQWLVLDAHSGQELGAIDGPTGPHNTIVSLDGKRVYLGGRSSNYLAVASTASNRIVRQIGPLKDGVRPFTINASQTLAFTTATGFLGFQVSSITTGKVLYTVPIRGYSYDPSSYSPSAPSHGVSLSPDGRQLYVIDGPNSAVHVFDVSRTPASAPRQVADIKLIHALDGQEDPCSNDCARDGWLQHSRNGRYVYVGDSGDVIDTRTRKVVAFLPALRETRKMLEVDWRAGKPVATTSRSGVGYPKP